MRLLKRLANNIDKQQAIEKYNEENDEKIYHMYELNDFLYDEGYSEEEIEEGLNIFNNDFDYNDEYFWKNRQNGYLYSGNLNDTYYTMVYRDNATNDSTLYRYVIEIDGKDYGFLHAIDKLVEKGILNYNDPAVKKSNVLFSSLETPPYMLSQKGSHWFTSKGNERYKYAIDNISKLLSEKDIKVKQLTRQVDDKVIEIDDYQAIVKK